ncbi:MAG: protein translocase subunit SecD [Nocardiopsis sp. BM-2018]|nr:MAG: protein translocase subunit SecD [Nocardiopsis sp. BM-2018]
MRPCRPAWPPAPTRRPRTTTARRPTASEAGGALGVAAHHRGGVGVAPGPQPRRQPHPGARSRSPVILAPTESADDDDLLVIRDLIRDELERLGIAEPDVRVESSNIVVDLPGVRDQREAVEAVDVAGIVTLRPVVQCVLLGPDDDTDLADPLLGQDLLPIRGTPESCVLGAVAGTGEVFERGSARARIDPQGGWEVAVDLRGGDGERQWNLLASQCFAGTMECPTRQLAIVLDDVIQSAPVVNAPEFRGAVSITGNFTEDEARGLARVLNRGAFPVDVEAQSVETVSPALGADTLRAAVIAGLVGAAAIMLLMIVYYRRLALISVTGLLVWATFMYSAAVYVSDATNYALSLAGATGIIVAIGLAVDSYVVLFERLKDELRNGRTPRNAAPRAFERSWRTIVSANVMSLLASVILFWLSVGSVRGFALYLGLTTVTSLIVYGLFARPAVILLSRTRWLDRGRPVGLTAEAGASA